MSSIHNVEILIVEDTEADAEMAVRAFKKNNLANNIYVVGDGEEALDFIYARGQFNERVNEAAPKIILLDLKLPKVDGLEVLRTLKNDPVKKMVPVIVLTSSREERDIVESYSLGVNSYIVKPVDFDKFVEAVKNLGLYWLLLNQAPNLK
ncbi:MAG: response regulator [Prolixibacteraceae bacterium]|nr:response regulator [Prolixibacteraceae bacterium]